MKEFRFLSLIVAAALALSTMACSTSGRVALDDQTIANNIKRQLEDPSGPAGPFGIDILVHKGSVSLDGKVPSQGSKEQAMQIAQQSQGVKDVKSFLVVE